MTDDAKAGTDTGADKDYSKSVTAALGVLQLTGVLAAFGFIVKFSREEFLGVSSGTWDATQLSSLAGGFAVDSATLLFAFVLHFAVYVPVGICCLLVIFGERWMQERYPQYLWHFQLCIYAILAVALTSVFVKDQAPTIELRGFLTTNPVRQPDISMDTADYKATNDLCRLIFGSRIANNKEQKKIFPILKGLRLTEQSARDVLNARYARSLLICILCWIFFFAEDKTTHPKGYGRSVALIFLMALVAVTIMLPYSYGKLIHSTRYPMALVQYTEADPGVATTTIASFRGPLIFQSDTMVQILAFKDDKPTILYIPADRLMYLHLYASQDALTYILQQQKQETTEAALQAPAAAQQAPAATQGAPAAAQQDSTANAPAAGKKKDRERREQ
jgi:hypothetical protein